MLAEAARKTVAFRAGRYKDLTGTGNRARKVSGTQCRFLFSGTCLHDSNNLDKQFYRTNYGYYSIQCKERICGTLYQKI